MSDKADEPLDLQLIPAADATTDEPSELQLEQILFGRFHIALFVLCGLGWMSDASEGAVLSYLLPQLHDEWRISTSQQGNLVSASSAGQAVGAFFIGLFSDHFGRRPAFIASVVLSAIFGAATVLVPNYEWMLVSRFIAGCAFGGNFPIAVSLITELVPTSHRSQCLILLQFFMELGAIIAAVAAWAVMPNWRLFILLSTTPACVAALFVVWIPESPSFLFAMGRTEEGSEVLRRIISFNSPPQSPKLAAKVEARDEAISKIVVPSKQEERVEHVISMANPETPDHNSSKWLIMLDPELRLALVAVLIAWFAAQIGSGWYIWVVDIADRLDLKHISHVLMIVARLVVIVSFSLVTLVVDKVKPCQMLIGFLFGTAISALAFGYIVANGPASWSFSAAFLAYVWFFAGAWPLLYVVSPKCFPTSARVTCVALASGMSKVGSIVQPQIFGHMLDSSLFGTGIVVTCGWILAMAGVLVIFMRDKYYD